MNQAQLANLFLDQSKDLIWMVNLDLQLVYANEPYLSVIKEMTGVENKLNESVFVEGFGEGYVEKWEQYYTKALKGTYFEIEEHYYNPHTNKIQYSQVTFQPFNGDDNNVIAIACQSKDITRIVQERSESKQLMDASFDVFCTVNEQGYFVYVSAAALNHWGYLPEELIGKTYQDFILEEDLRKTIEIAATIFNGHETKSFSNRYKKKDGGVAHNLWSARWDKNSKLIYAVARDGQEKIAQDEKIQQSELRFKSLVQEGSDLIAILDAQGNYMFVSPTSISVLGILPEELIGRNAFEFIHPNDAERTLAYFREVVNNGKVEVEPFRFQNHKKEWRWIETIFTNMLRNPAVKGIVANSRDITDKIEERRKQKLLESVITNTKDAILITEAEPFDAPGHRIIYVNEAFTKMTGYTAEEVIGKTPRILQGPNTNKKELAELGRSIRNWASYETTVINYKKNGEEFWINFTLTPVADEKGRYTHWISIERDVTEQKVKELEKELLAQISVNFNTENDLISSATALCKSVSKFGNFDWVELWTSNLEKSRMQLLSHYVESPADEKFYENIDAADTYLTEEGLAGKLWSERTQLFWTASDDNKDFNRREAAKKIGLKAVLAIRLIFNDQVLGVLNIGTKCEANYFKKYNQIFKRLEGFIGSELNRKKLEYELSHLFHSIPDVLCLLDFRGRFLKINKAGCELMGYKQEDILYHTSEEFVHPLDKGLFTNEIFKSDAEETKFEFENRYINKNGEIVWLSWYCIAVLQESVVYATAKNITEEKKLRELNLQTRSMAKIGSWEMNLMNQNVYWSEEIHQIHETNSKSFTANLETALGFYRNDFQLLVNTCLEKCISKAEPFDYEAVLVTAKKNERWVRAIGNAEFAHGKCVRIYGSFQDIHQRKEAEVRLLSLADNLPGVVYQYVVNPDGTDSVQYVTKGSKQVWGFTAEEVINDNQLVWNNIIAGGEIDKVKRSIAQSIASKTKWTSRWKYVMPNGKIKTHLGYGSPNFLADGTVLFHSLILDVTQEVANEDLIRLYTLELERSNEELEQFAFVASHDLQEPLRMISSFMDQLLRKYGHQLDSKAHQYIYFATDGAKRMRQIVLDLLEFSRASKPKDTKKEIDFNEIITEFKQLRRKVILEKKAKIVTVDLPKIYTYKSAISQIFNCILDNALKYSQKGIPPIVEINALENKKTWQFSIKDNGIGIDPQFYDKIFIIFQRLHNKDAYSGTGIGLTIVKRHVEFLGGKIWLESNKVEGTTFYFTIAKTRK